MLIQYGHADSFENPILLPILYAHYYEVITSVFNTGAVTSTSTIIDKKLNQFTVTYVGATTFYIHTMFVTVGY